MGRTFNKIIRKISAIAIAGAIVLTNINIPVYAESLSEDTTIIENNNYKVEVSRDYSEDIMDEDNNYISVYNNFDIKGKNEGGGYISTTCGGFGYDFFIRKSPDSKDNSYYSNSDSDRYRPMYDNSVLNGAVDVDIDFSFVRNQSYVQIKYILENITDESIDVDFGFSSDVLIGSDDSATVSTTNTGLKLEETKTDTNTDTNTETDINTGRQFSLAFKNIGGIDATNYWFGKYHSRDDNFYGQTTDTELVGIDSEIAVSWTDQHFNAKQKKEYIVFFALVKLQNHHN